jgi:hypothetical protein
MVIDVMVVVPVLQLVVHVLWGCLYPPFISKGARVQGRYSSQLQYDPNQDSISTCLFYIYFYRYNYLCLGEHAMVL